MSAVWLSFIISPPSLGITDEHFFQVIQKSIYYKNPALKVILGNRQRRQEVGSRRVRFAPVSAQMEHTVGEARRMSSPHMNTAQGHADIFS